MRKLCILLMSAAMLTSSVVASAQADYVPSKENLEARERFEDHRFGIFLHWGIYSMFAQGEWYLNKGINAQEYAKAAGGFYPAAFNAREWVKAIKASGAKYICFTSRHHDGFSMYDTKVSDYDIIDASPFKRDVIAQLSQACAEEGIDFHLYYSLIDWTRDDYPAGRTGLKTGKDKSKEDYPAYVQFMKDQLSELLTGYGNVRAIWFDGVWDHDSDATPFDWKLDEVYGHIHNVKPACLIGNNHHLTPFKGEDFQMFERDLPGENTTGWADDQTVSTLPLEMCQTMNGMWGYKLVDQNYKSTETLIRLLVSTSGKGANLLLNVGPQPNGELPATALARMKEMGEWLRENGETVYGTTAGDIPAQEWGVTTRKGDRLFVHIFDCKEKELVLPLDCKVKKAVTYSDKQPVKFQKTKDGTKLMFNEIPSGMDYIVELVTK